MTTEKYYCLLYSSVRKLLNKVGYGWNGEDIQKALQGIEIALQTVAAAEDVEDELLPIE